MDTALIIYSFVLVLFVLFIPKGMLTSEIFKNRYKVKNLSALEWLECYAPFRNTYIIKKAFDEPSKTFKFLNWFFPVMIFVTIIVRFSFPVSENRTYILLQLLFTLLMFIVLALLYITEVYIHWDLCNMLDRRKMKVLAFLPPLCSFILARSVTPYFKKNRHIIDGTFDGNYTVR